MKKIVMLMVVSALGFSGALFANGNSHGEDKHNHGKDNYEACRDVMGAIKATSDDSGYDVLTTALGESVYSGRDDNDDHINSTEDTGTNGGFDLNMWATVVATDGTVCAVTKTGAGLNDQWLGSRVISAQKANTAIAFSLPGLALSTANLWAPTQPGGSLFGLQFSNPVDTEVAYEGDADDFGTARTFNEDTTIDKKGDPMVGHRIGGVNVFGGGLALYNAAGLIGAIGVSGDSSCADHNIAWRVRDALGLDHVPGGVNSDSSDNIIFDLVDGVSANGFGHPTCGVSNEKTVNDEIVGALPIGDNP
jgi:uncharacterized protein GlcG (DUF336 family)